MRLHIGAGTVYLAGFVNLDLPSPTTCFASDRPDLVERWITTDDQYYARHRDKTIDTLRNGPLGQEYVCDRYGDFHNLPDGPIEELLARQTFEHLSITEARRALERLKRRMDKGSILRIDVPDHQGTLQKFRETGDEFYIRHLLGPRRNDYGFHMMSYTKERLTRLVEEYGFKLVEEEPNIHLYPAFCLKFRKMTDDAPKPVGPCDYVELPHIPAEWSFADVGPGQFPHPRADFVIDHDRAVLANLPLNATQIVSDLEEGLPEIGDKEFDYVWASHVLEHCLNVREAVAALNRIGKRGTIVVPSAFKDALFNWEEPAHVWHILPHPESGGPPIFVRYNETQIAALRDEMVQRATCDLYRNGTNHDCTVERGLQTWFAANERGLDVVCSWDEKRPLEVIVIEARD